MDTKTPLIVLIVRGLVPTLGTAVVRVRRPGRGCDAAAWGQAHRRYNRTVKELVFVVEEAPEGGFTARALGVPVFTEAETLDTLREAIRDAVRCHFEPGEEPRVLRLHVVHEELMAP